jgi:hypothetical protein
VKVRYRVIESEVFGKQTRYYAQHRPWWWPFWFYAREEGDGGGFGPDILVFWTEAEAVAWCQKDAKFYVRERVIPVTHPTQEADK